MTNKRGGERMKGGSEKQINFAIRIKEFMQEKLTEKLDKAPDVVKEAYEKVINNTDCIFWIDNFKSYRTAKGLFTKIHELAVTGQLDQVHIPCKYIYGRKQKTDLKKAPKKNQPSNAGAPWTENDDTALQDDYNAGLTVEHIAVASGRTAGSISSRLKKFKYYEEVNNEQNI